MAKIPERENHALDDAYWQFVYTVVVASFIKNRDAVTDRLSAAYQCPIISTIGWAIYF